ncbi:amino acid/polyamine/organocation transporter, APC superfamily (TC 2.A.3) [Klenkia marina]|uniref:Amino acid/polyamine/organocation transporter, APC superfamily (TC 2.A.3) n=1 Tax=Klenkia marina TaxID=1960309 RepID=A0A1G4XTJ8_9ACTN|nr:APC family permease [Klenkia marina]SCX44536.1 amino acid/polyamine/organocation transporter, APC superfamily (TC 2.A.3) [Klenkia marina]
MATDLPPAPAAVAPDAPGLRRNALGTGGIVFLVVAAAAPLTVMAGVAPLALLVGGIGAPAGYLAAGVVLTIFAVAFTAMTKHVGSAGAFYSYVTRGLGQTAGLAAAVLALVSYSGLQVGVYGLLAQQTQATLLDVLGISLPWPVIALVGIAIVTAVCWFGIEVGAKVLGVLLVAETAILALMAGGVIAEGGAEGLSGGSFAVGNLTGPGMAAILALCFAAFMGFESTAIYRSEARRPERTIPRATYIAVGFMAIFYCVVVWSVVQAFGEAGVQGTAAANLPGLFFEVIATYVGPWAATLMQLLVVSSVLASQIAFHNAVTRYALALSEDGVLPAGAGRLHPRHQSPTTAGLVQSGIAALAVVAFGLAGADPFRGLLVWINTPAVVGVLLLQVLTAVSVVVFFTRADRPARHPVAVVAGVLSAVLLAVATALLVDNVSLLTATESSANWIVVGIVPVVLVVGVVVARWLKGAKPEVYARVGRGTVPTAEAHS